MKTDARVEVAQQESAVGCSLPPQASAKNIFSPADSDAMCSTATVETFSIKSSHGRDPKCNAHSFEGTHAAIGL